MIVERTVELIFLGTDEQTIWKYTRLFKQKNKIHEEHEELQKTTLMYFTIMYGGWWWRLVTTKVYITLLFIWKVWIPKHKPFTTYYPSPLQELDTYTLTTSIYKTFTISVPDWSNNLPLSFINVACIELFFFSNQRMMAESLKYLQQKLVLQRFCDLLQKLCDRSQKFCSFWLEVLQRFHHQRHVFTESMKSFTEVLWPCTCSLKLHPSSHVITEAL